MATQTTTSQPIQLSSSEEQDQADSQSRRIIRRFLGHRMAVIGSTILIAIVLYVTVGTLFYSEEFANYNDTSRRLQAPSAEHLMGTDTIGRDVMARTIYGGQISLIIGVFAVVVSVTIGMTFGVLSGYYGGVVDMILMRFTEAMLSIPSLLLLLVMAKYFSGRVPEQEILGRTFSGSVIVIIVIIGLTSWMYLSRIVRSTVLSIRETEYVMAARAVGANNTRVIFVHIIPNVLAPVIVASTLGVASAILSEAYISFLSFGVQPPTATWGNMLTGAQAFIDEAPWLWIFPCLLLVLTLMSINFIGDGLRDALDPRSTK